MDKSGLLSDVYSNICSDVIIELCKNVVNGRINKNKLKNNIAQYIKKKTICNNMSTIDEEIDFEGLTNYLKKDVITDVKKFIIAQGDDRERLKEDIINRSVSYSNAKTRVAIERAKTITSQVIDIVYVFCRNSDSLKDTDFLRLLTGEVEEKILNAEKNIQEHLDRTENKIDNLSDKVDKLGDNNDNNSVASSEPVFLNHIKKNKQPYIDMLSRPLFLHKKHKDNVTLNSTFIFPSYTIDNQKGNDNLEDFLIDFITDESSRTLLITGEPGIGKSSLVAKIVEPYVEATTDDENKPTRISQALKEYNANDSIIVIKFTELEEYKKTTIIDALYAALKCTKRELANKVLILDGFDEIENKSLINDIDNFLIDIKKISNYKLIVTSRENYIHNSEKFNKHICLEPFSEEKIIEYYEKLNRLSFPAEQTLKNTDIIGIPVILYMALTVGLDITEDASRAELYEKIFDRNSGIWHRFEGVDGSSEAYAGGSHPMMKHADEYIKFLSKLAFLMFDNNQIPLERNDEDEDIKAVFTFLQDNIIDFPIDSLYEKTKNEVQFIHRSIYEFFTAEYIYQIIKTGVDIKTQAQMQSFAGKLAETFKSRKISDEIRDYLYYKIAQRDEIRDNKFVINTFDLMLEDGMTYYSDEKYKKNIDRELTVFANMLEVIHAWKYIGKLTYDEYCQKNTNINSKLVCEGFIKLKSKDYLARFAKINNIHNINLSSADLRGADLNGADLREADLRGADLREVILNGADLLRADLRDADLSKAHLRGSFLSGADLRRAFLIGADLRRAFLMGADLRKADLNGADLSAAGVSETIFDTDNIKQINVYYPIKISETLVWVFDLNTVISYPAYKYWQEHGVLPDENNEAEQPE